MNNLMEKLEKNKTACVGIIGLGNDELPFAITFSKKSTIIKLDVYDKFIANLLSEKSHIFDVLDSVLRTYLGKSFLPRKNPEVLRKCDLFNTHS